ncbi:ferritin-like domain-containing protein [Ruegeria sp. HKCCA6707]|uniref:ferritin-like domain-containing protein n=1 Tax=Ruegeria sp. HKCCA6707 TaxID=2682996 RepID=UPI0020C3A2A7|nr:ferritin-like domain-containing protein [Ruegeria sp. HKCCA6707]
MDTIQEIFFLPPMAVARLGPGETPLESYEWQQDMDAHGNNKTVIRSNVTLREVEDGSVRAYLPDPKTILFRDEGGALRPVAPFFELWAKMHDAETGEDYETPVTLDLLDGQGLSLQNVRYSVTVGNQKAERRTGDAACGFRARVEITGQDFSPKPLLAFSPHTSEQQPMVYEHSPIPLGTIRAMHPVRGQDEPVEGQPVDRSILRLRFTPPKGEVYGPPDAAFGPATLAVPAYQNDPPKSEYGRIHEIVPEQNRILNPDTPWSRWIMMSGMSDDPEPHDSYDGARVGNNQSWGVADDTSDGTIEATLNVRGERLTARARIFTGPPDFAPDARPFYSIEDDLLDRDLSLMSVTKDNYVEAKDEVVDIFRRAFETNSLVNLDDIRAQGLKDNATLQAQTKMPAFPEMPSTDAASMTEEDQMPPDKIPDLIRPQPVSVFSNSVPNERLPYTVATKFVHEQLIDEENLLDFLRRRPDFVKNLLRPPFGILSELETDPSPDQTPNPNFRDPRIVRDMMHDARMPPYMRDSNYFPLSLSRRQYHLILSFIDCLVEHAPEAPPAPKAPDPSHLKPRNLTARAAFKVPGNPDNTRLDGSVGNCFPGLEMDVRDLDRRFFPGLVFNAVRVPLDPFPEAPKHSEGFHLVFVDYFYDPMLPDNSPEAWVQKLLTDYSGAVGTKLSQGRWFLSWVEQSGKKITFKEEDGTPYDGLKIWRFIRSLECGDDKPVTIALERRNHEGVVDTEPVVLHGYRRQYRTEDGVFSDAYDPGELTQSLCNPWSHDFRDCGCHYWPSNHPDVVMAEVDHDAALPTGQSDNPLAAETYLDWLRSDKSPSGNVAALNTVEQNRPYQIDHYQVNRIWSELPIVVEGRETGETYEVDPELHDVEPYGSIKEMVDDLKTRLAPMEMTLSLQYLYAYFSLADPETVDHKRWPTLKDDLIFSRRSLVEVAIGEMTHMRWANQLLWELEGEAYKPVLTPAKTLRFGAQRVLEHHRALRPLTPEAIDDFIEIERPGGYIDRAYAQCVATLEQDKTVDRRLYALAVRIDTDGDEHFLRFKQMKEVLAQYDIEGQSPAYLRPVEPGNKTNAKAALELFEQLKKGLHEAYLLESQKQYEASQEHIDQVRETMKTLRVKGEELAAKGIGIPFWPEEKK